MLGFSPEAEGWNDVRWELGLDCLLRRFLRGLVVLRARPQGGDQLGGCCKNPAERGGGWSGSRDREEGKL